MIGASLFIAACTARNRLRMRLRRLREPRYLIGALLGAAYIAFIFVVPRRAAGRRRFAPEDLPEELSPGAAFGRMGQTLGAAGLAAMAVVAWIFPSRSHLFTFTEAEIALLFPAPVSRRALIVHRLVRSQVGLAFAALLPAVLFTRPGPPVPVWDRFTLAVGLLIVLTTIRVYFAGVTMAREHLASADGRARAAAWLPLAVAVAAAAAVAVPLARVLAVPFDSVPEALARAGQATAEGPAAMVLLPIRLLLGPMSADGMAALALALAGAGTVLAAVLGWVIVSDGIYQRAGADPAAAQRRGRPRQPVARARGDWPLAAAGRPELAFFWKGGLQTLREADARSFIPILFLAAYAVVGAWFWMSAGAAAAVCVAALMLAVFGTLLGPGSVGTDLRGDLRHMEVLKTWPVRGAAVVRGEMLWPGLLVTAGVWCLITVALVLSGSAFPQVSLVWRVSLYGAALLVVPALVFAQYAVHQAAAVLFPGWIPPDSNMRGFESMAQRLVLFAGVALALGVMLAPGVLAGGALGAGLYWLTGSPLALVAAGGVCLAAVAVEVFAISEALGPAYEQVDLSGVERAE